MKYKITKIICVLLILLAYMYDLYISFTNIEMTRTRLFITYWWQYLITIIVSIVALLVYQYIDKKEFDKIFYDIIKDRKKGE